MRRIRVHPVLVALAAMFVAACPRPTDGDPQIPISPGLEGRMALAPGHGAPRPKAAAAAKAPGGEGGRAHARPMKPGEQLGGPNATGKPGDWLLANDEVVFVIDALGGGEGFAESGGNLIDAADARARKDDLGQIISYFGVFPRQGVYTSIDVSDLPSGEAIVRAKGHELQAAALEVETEYRLGAGDRALLVTTSIKNTGAADVTLPGVGDAIQWGGTDKVTPGKPMGFKGPSSGPFIGGVGRLASYALTTPDGKIDAVSGTTWTDTDQQTNVVVARGATVTYARVFAVGERADVASIVSELTKASGGELGGVEIALTDASGKAVRVPAGAKAIVSTAAGEEVMTFVAAKDDDTFGGELPPGKWLVSFAPSAGRRAAQVTGSAGAGAKVAVTVNKDAVTKAVLSVTDAARLDASCTEHDAAASGARVAVPCKITIEGLEGTPSPDLGPSFVAGTSKNQLIANVGAVALAPGKYRLTSTRGPEYGAQETEVTLAPGQTRAVIAALERVVDTTGYVATDFHQHTIRSADSPVSLRDRVLANVAEAVEVGVASEHNVVADLTPVIREAGMSQYVVSIAGDELTTDASVKPWGHANVFPLVPDPAKPRGGAVTVRDRTAQAVLAEVRALPGPERVVQINHPRAGTIGYFDRLGFDPATGTATGAGYEASFDALEVWNSRNVDWRTKVLLDYFGLLRTSHPVTAIADTDTHGIIGQEPGFPRTYVRVAKDTDLATWDAARTADLVRSVRDQRDVVLTNGPFLRVTAVGANGDVGIGGVVRPRSGTIEVKVAVTSAAFARCDHAEIRFAGSGKVLGASAVPLAPKPNAAGALESSVTFTISAAADEAFVVIVSGSRPMRPMFSGDDRELMPWAMTGAIWIDANGDGKALARETARR